MALRPLQNSLRRQRPQSPLPPLPGPAPGRPPALWPGSSDHSLGSSGGSGWPGCSLPRAPLGWPLAPLLLLLQGLLGPGPLGPSPCHAAFKAAFGELQAAALPRPALAQAASQPASQGHGGAERRLLLGRRVCFPPCPAPLAAALGPLLLSRPQGSGSAGQGRSGAGQGVVPAVRPPALSAAAEESESTWLVAGCEARRVGQRSSGSRRVQPSSLIGSGEFVNCVHPARSGFLVGSSPLLESQPSRSRPACSALARPHSCAAKGWQPEPPGGGVGLSGSGTSVLPSPPTPRTHVALNSVPRAGATIQEGQGQRRSGWEGAGAAGSAPQAVLLSFAPLPPRGPFSGLGRGQG